MNVKKHNKCINADRFYTPRRFTLLCVKPSGYAKRYMSKKNNMKYAKYRTLLILCVFLNPSQASIPYDAKYDINCGIAKPVSNTFEIIKIGTNIPFVTINQDPNFYFGCTVKINNVSVSKENKYTLHAKLTFPQSSLASYGSNTGYSKMHQNGKLVVTIDPVTFTRIDSINTGYVVFRLDEDDPVGEYLVDIYVNDLVEKQVIFNVSK